MLLCWFVYDTLWDMEYELTHVKGLIKAVQDMVSNYERLKNKLEYYQMCT